MTEPERGVSAYVLAEPGTGEFSWQWPLRIGILADDASSERLRGEIEGSLWWPQLQTVVDPREGCDVLLLPWSASEADARETMPEVSPGLVVVLGPIDVEPSEVARVADRLASRLGAWGCHLAGAPGSNSGWLNAVVEGLSHDDPIDFALKRAEITHNGAGYSALSYRLVADSRLSETIARFADRLSQRPALRDRCDRGDIASAPRARTSRARSSPEHWPRTCRMRFETTDSPSKARVTRRPVWRCWSPPPVSCRHPRRWPRPTEAANHTGATRGDHENEVMRFGS